MTTARKIISWIACGLAMACLGSGLTLALVGYEDQGLWVVTAGLGLALSSRPIRTGRL